MDAPDRRRNLLVAGGAAGAVAAAGYDLYIWIDGYLRDNFHNDLTFYVAAARLGLSHGWSNLYDLNLQQDQLVAIGSAIRMGQLARYVSPPPLAWLAVPFSPLPFRLAYWLWSLVLLIALALTWRLAAPGQGRVRLIYLAAAIGWLPVIYGLTLGQPVLFVAAGVAGCYALLLRDRPAAAGAALAVLVLKPQVAFLVPAALLVTGRWRAFSGAAVVLAALAILSALALGASGVATYEQRLNFASNVPENQAQTLAPLIGNLVATRVAQAAIALWTLGLAYSLRNRGPGLILAVVLVGGLAASPYVHYDDLTMLGLAGWLYIRSTKQRWGWIYVVALAIAAEGFPIWGAAPILVGELGALALLTLFAPPAASDPNTVTPRGNQLESPLPRKRESI
ncbi:MAG TPA: glycosyltransferase family 87 protein [Candidatus Dormibacteraeota bacterium]|nr:glycosyltransferase family 87 protein [Candidatus Dormibacteraeota bacterium]